MSGPGDFLCFCLCDGSLQLPCLWNAPGLCFRYAGNLNKLKLQQAKYDVMSRGDLLWFDFIVAWSQRYCSCSQFCKDQNNTWMSKHKVNTVIRDTSYLHGSLIFEKADGKRWYISFCLTLNESSAVWVETVRMQTVTELFRLILFICSNLKMLNNKCRGVGWCWWPSGLGHTQCNLSCSKWATLYFQLTPKDTVL